MIALTTAEARRLFNLSTAPATRARPRNWSDWRRAHQATARRSHYKRRLKNHGL